MNCRGGKGLNKQQVPLAEDVAKTGLRRRRADLAQPVARALALQRQAGNRAVARLLSLRAVVQRDASSDDYRQGYQDGSQGRDNAGVPRDGDALTDYNEGFDKGRYEFEQRASAPGGPTQDPASDTNGTSPGGPDLTSAWTGGPVDQSSALAPTGAVATEQPASFAVGGLPAFRYNLPSVPIASAHLDTPDASVDIDLSLIGNVSVTFPNAPKGISTDVNNLGWRMEATSALAGINDGIRVNGIGTGNPSIGVTVGTEFEQSEIRFIPPNAVAFRGLARIAYTRPSPLGPVSVQGQPGFELRVTVTPHPDFKESPAVYDQESWFAENEKPLLAIGALLLVGMAIAAAPATGGGSLVLLAAG